MGRIFKIWFWSLLSHTFDLTPIFFINLRFRCARQKHGDSPFSHTKAARTCVQLPVGKYLTTRSPGGRQKPWPASRAHVCGVGPRRGRSQATTGHDCSQNPQERLQSALGSWYKPAPAPRSAWEFGNRGRLAESGAGAGDYKHHAVGDELLEAPGRLSARGHLSEHPGGSHGSRPQPGGGGG